jgi:hypothetical protein
MVVIPVRPGFFDIATVQETVKTSREQNKPYAVVINSAPVKREQKEAPSVRIVARRIRQTVDTGMVGSNQPTRRVFDFACRGIERGRTRWRSELHDGNRRAVVSHRAFSWGNKLRLGGAKQTSKSSGLMFQFRNRRRRPSSSTFGLGRSRPSAGSGLPGVTRDRGRVPPGFRCGDHSACKCRCHSGMIEAAQAAARVEYEARLVKERPKEAARKVR